MKFAYDTEALARERLTRGLTLIELAQKARLSKETVSRILRVGRTRSRAVLALARVLGIDVKSIVVRTDLTPQTQEVAP